MQAVEVTMALLNLKVNSCMVSFENYNFKPARAAAATEQHQDCPTGLLNYYDVPECPGRTVAAFRCRLVPGRAFSTHESTHCNSDASKPEFESRGG